MTMRRLLWGMTWRSTVAGILSSVILGQGYTIVLVTQAQQELKFLDVLLGSVYYSILGLFVAIPWGITMGFLTKLFFYPMPHAALYRWIIGVVGALFGIVYSFTGFMSSYFLLACRPCVGKILVGYIIQATNRSFVAGIVAILISQYIARWYKNEMRKQSS